MIEKDNNLYASDGMLLTDGETFCKVVYLGAGVDASRYREVSEEEYRAMQAVSEVPET